MVALAIQVGTNYANDYSDGIRGTDERPGGPAPPGGVGTGLAAGGQGGGGHRLRVAGVVGLGLAWATSWWILPVGAACLAAGWFYTGGPRPYGYVGLGRGVRLRLLRAGGHRRHLLRADAAVEQSRWCGWPPCWSGLLATALLLANNLRDIATDAPTGKRTLVGAGRPPGRWALYVACVVVPFVAAALWALGSFATVGDPWRAAAALLPLLAAAPGGGPGEDGAQRRRRSRPAPRAGRDRSAPAGLRRAAGRRRCGCGSGDRSVGRSVSAVRRSRPTGQPPHPVGDVAGLLQVGGVTGAGHHLMGGVGPDGGGQPATEVGELAVVGPRDDEHGKGQRPTARPTTDAGCRPRPGAGWRPARPRCWCTAPRIRRPRGGCRRTGVRPATAGGRWAPAGRPARRGDPAGRPGRLSVRRRSWRWSASSIPAVPEMSTSPADQVGTGQGQVETEARPHRVPDVDSPSAGLPDQQGPVGEAGPDRRGATVTGQVHPHELVVGGQMRGPSPPTPARFG